MECRPRPIEALPAADQGLFDALGTLRSQLARARKVPAYVVFTDCIPRAMAQQHSDTMAWTAKYRRASGRIRVVIAL